jgi:hypothetical protein
MSFKGRYLGCIERFKEKERKRVTEAGVTRHEQKEMLGSKSIKLVERRKCTI